MRFLNSGQPIAFNIYGNMIYTPTYWTGLSDYSNPFLKVHDIVNITGIDTKYYEEMLGMVDSPTKDRVRDINVVRINSQLEEKVLQYQSISFLPKNSWVT